MKLILFAVYVILVTLSCKQKQCENVSYEAMQINIQQIQERERMKVYYFPLSATTYFAINPENIKYNATISLDLSRSDTCYQMIRHLINSDHYKSNYGAFDQNGIRIRIDIIVGDANEMYLIDISGAILINGKSFKLTTIGILDSTIMNCKL